MPVSIRQRIVSRFSGRGAVFTIVGKFVSFSTYLDYDIVAKQITTSTDNPGWLVLKSLKRNPNYRKLPKRRRTFENRNWGGNFTTERHRHEVSHPSVVANDGGTGTTRVYKGPLFALRSVNTGASTGYPTLTAVSEAEIIARGATFIANTLPTNPVAGVAQFLGELREGLPQLPGKAFFDPRNRTALGALRQSGSEYVNLQFAALPMIKDIFEIADTVKRSEKIVQQYTRDSGRNIYRRAELPVSTTTEISTMVGDRTISPPLHSSFYSPSTGPLILTRVTTTKWRFSACYTYYLDPGETALGKMKRDVQIANKLYGIRITPELIWELTPWSWAADYVGNIGDILTNVSALMSDSLVIRYAYVMCEQRVTDTYVQSTASVKGAPGPYSQTFETIRKVRRVATPYGFGLNPDAFTPRQWAIIGALGISKGPRQL